MTDIVTLLVDNQPIEVAFYDENTLEAQEKALQAVAAQEAAEAALQATELARDQAADLVLPENIFVDVSLGTAEAAVTTGTTFKLVNSSTGIADVRKRISGGSTLLYQELTKAGLAMPAGAGSVGFQQSGTGAIPRFTLDKLREDLSATDFGAVANTALVDSTAAIQAALDHAEQLVNIDLTWRGNGGVYVRLPRGAYRISSKLRIPNLVWLVGEGRENTCLVTANDIVMVESKANINQAAVGVGVVGLKLVKERNASTTYHIAVNNPTLFTARDIYTFTLINDTIPEPTNFGGIKLARTGTWSGSSFINRIHDCFIQNGGVLVDNVTDGEITDSYIYGHNCNHTIKFTGVSGNWAIQGNNLTSPQANASIWLADPQGSNFRVIGNFFDGLVVELTKGHGILSNGVHSVLVSANHFTHQLSAIRAVRAYFWTVSGNHCRNCNNKDPGATPGSWPDFELLGLSGYNTFTGNTHQQLESRGASPGYAILETADGSGAPNSNVYTGNAIFGVAGGYAQNPDGSGAILVPGTNNRVLGNAGVPVERLAPTLLKGQSGLEKEATADVANNGTLDLVVNSSSYFGNPGGFVGILHVAATRTTAATISRLTTYRVHLRGTAIDLFKIGGDTDGTSGGATYTLTAPSNGTIRFTNTAGDTVSVRLKVDGVMSLA